tara:strand:- start:1681 stop:2064 length:384 start_codon:yes stop_codon:yes gene_type:complete
MNKQDQIRLIKQIQEISIKELFILYKEIRDENESHNALIIIEEYLMSKAYDIEQIEMMEEIEDPELKSYNNYNIWELITYIQPYINMTYFEPPKSKLTNLLTLYQEKGGDKEYFISGAGAPGNCIIS